MSADSPVTDGRALSYEPRSGSEGVKSASRVLAVISLLTAQSGGATFGEICLQLGMPKSSTHALLRTMTDHGFLVVEEATRRYRVGIRLWEAGQTYIDSLDLPAIAQPFMETARDLLHETVQLAVLDNADNVYVAKVDSDQRLILQSRIGGRLPAYATGLGKVLLAGLTDAEVRRRFAGVRLEPFTGTTITDIDTLIERLHAIRDSGYGTDDGEYTPGVVCVALPIHDRSGVVTAAMSVSVPEVRSSLRFAQQTLEVLTKQSRAVSASLGHRPEPQ